MTRVAVVRFPGSNCEPEACRAVERAGGEAFYVWYRDSTLQGADAVILPGGFSYGDYLRAGAIAQLSPIMREVRQFAAGGGPVVGICNGFQILCEAGMLPGALIRNRSLRFVSKAVHIRVEASRPPFTADYAVGQVLRIPIAHGEGCYVADDHVLDELEGEGRVAFRYCTEAGEVTEAANPNGSTNNIAGIVSPGGNVLGMMPHPERAVDPLLGSDDGAPLFRSVADFLAGV